MMPACANRHPAASRDAGRGRTFFWTAVTALVLAGCADPARNVYEGVRTRDTTMQTPVERSTQPAPTYEEYERERRKAGGQ